MAIMATAPVLPAEKSGPRNEPNSRDGDGRAMHDATAAALGQQRRERNGDREE